MSALFDSYVEKVHAKEFIVFNLGEDWEGDGDWHVCIRTSMQSKKSFDISNGEGKTPGQALKNAYRKLWPIKKRNKNVARKTKSNPKTKAKRKRKRRSQSS